MISVVCVEGSAEAPPSIARAAFSGTIGSGIRNARRVAVASAGRALRASLGFGIPDAPVLPTTVDAGLLPAAMPDWGTGLPFDPETCKAHIAEKVPDSWLLAPKA